MHKKEEDDGKSDLAVPSPLTLTLTLTRVLDSISSPPALGQRRVYNYITYYIVTK